MPKPLLGTITDRRGRERDRSDPDDRRPLTGWREAVVWAVFVLACLLSAVNVGRGLFRAREPEARGDLVHRETEYSLFRLGIYPDTVYPPYVFPMFAAFFEPGGLRQGAVIVECASLAALVLIGWYGVRELRFGGPALASVGAVTASACAGVVGCLWVGQFSLLCVGFLVAQILCIERGRAGAAGLCWALAMIKPQIALPFALLFLRDRQWRGLLVGGAVLVGLTLFACAWTDVSPLRLIHHFAFRESLRWTANDGTFGPGVMAKALRLKPRDMQVAVVAAAGLLGAAGLWAMRGRVGSFDLLPLAGACGLLGEVLFYHRAYDHVMLTPAVFAALARAAARPTPASVALAVILPATVWLPNRLVVAVPYGALGMAAVWAAAAVVMRARAGRPAPRGPAGGAIAASA